MPELPTFPQQSHQLTLAEVTSVYAVLHNYVRVHESSKFKPGSREAFQYLRIKSVVRKFEAHLDARADNQLRTDAVVKEADV